MTVEPNPTSSDHGKGKHIFVTVGTTRFDKLVSLSTSKVALEWMERQGFSSLTIQYGRGEKPNINTTSSLRIECYDFRPSLIADMEEADLILSHAGAGTVMEVLRITKKLVVVINTQLMDNHQTELAGAMAERGHLLMVEKPEMLNEIQTWASFVDFSPTPHQKGDANDMPLLLDSFFGFRELKRE